MAPWSIEYRVLEIYDRFLVAQVIGKSEVLFDKKRKTPGGPAKRCNDKSFAFLVFIETVEYIDIV